MDIDVLLDAIDTYKMYAEFYEKSDGINGTASREIRATSDRKRAELISALNQYIDSRIRHVLSGTE